MTATRPTALQAIVFDFDGVLADTEPLHLRAFQDVLARRGLVLAETDYLARYLGFDDAGVFSQFAADRHQAWSGAEIAELVRDKAIAFEQMAARGPIVFPGVVERLTEWSALLPLAVASGALRAEVEAILGGAGLLHTVRVVVAAGETPRGKPAPDPYLRALDLLGTSAGTPVDPARTVAIEDSVWGIESAHAAGMRVVALATSYPAGRLGQADLVLPAFGALELGDLERIAAPRS